MNDKTIKFTLVGPGEPLLRLQKRLGCAATELGVTLLLDIEKDPGAVGLPRTEEIVALLGALPETRRGAQA